MTTPLAEQINDSLLGYDRLYGLRFLDIGEQDVSACVQVRDELKQPMGLLHGGVYASIAESICSIATAIAVLSDGQVALGMANSTSFLRPITEGAIHARATRLHRGRTRWLWDVRFSDDRERLCALTLMTIAVRAMPTGS
jgi:1,4-dihydroxy-2-naphthoyl-CoA hydrolase